MLITNQNIQHDNRVISHIAPLDIGDRSIISCRKTGYGLLYGKFLLLLTVEVEGFFSGHGVSCLCLDICTGVAIRIVHGPH